MDKRQDIKQKSMRLMAYLIFAGNLIYTLAGIMGSVFAEKSTGQLISWQVGNAGAICAAIIAASLLYEMDWLLPTSGFIILGIVHGIFFSSITMTSVEENIFVTGAIILVPAIGLMSIYLVPTWLKLMGWLTVALFMTMYVRSVAGIFRFNEWTQVVSYMAEQITLLGWSYFLLRDTKAHLRRAE